MRIKTEHDLRGRRLKAYRLGYEQGMKDAPRVDDQIRRDDARRMERVVRQLDGQITELKRELQFANDRIEQLMNSVVIIRDLQ